MNEVIGYLCYLLKKCFGGDVFREKYQICDLKICWTFWNRAEDDTFDHESHDFWLTAYPSTRISIATFPTLITFLTIRNLLISLFVSSSFGFWSVGLFRLKIRTSFSSFFNNFESTNSTRSDRPKSTQDWRTKWFDSWRRDCSTILRTLISYKNVMNMTQWCIAPNRYTGSQMITDKLHLYKNSQMMLL